MTKNIHLISVMVLALLIHVSCATEPELLDPIVQTQSGLVEGVANEAGTIMAFKGLPYAAPPVGDLRWREPQPPLSWEGVRDASDFCASCIQNKAGSRLPWTEEFMVQNDISEDCLFLNIWSPASTSDNKLAVFVYLHGGGFSEGSGAIDVYDGEELAKKGVVVVTINYRLGVLGFLVHPELTAESSNNASGNYGLLDQIAALQWLRDNIAAFGGDPDRVTISGQSAGAASVRALIASPLSKGLFHGAITQSGTSYVSFFGSASLSDVENRGVEFATSKGASSIAELRAMPALDVFLTAPDQTPVRFSSVIDGYVLTDNHTDVFAKGAQNDTPFMTGMNRDELRYRGERSEDFFTLYPVGSDGDTSRVERVAAQEQSRLNAALWMEHRAKTSSTKGYIYYFNQAVPWPEHPEFGAYHTGEVPYMFNNLKILDRPWTAVDTMVADVMSSYWANFVKNGDPNGEGLPNWAAYDSNNPEVMRLGEEMGMIPVAASEERLKFLKAGLLGN